MQFPKASAYPSSLVKDKIMGPNPLKVCEELLANHHIAPAACIVDLGSGSGITSVMLAKDYGFETYAVDLWSDPEENTAFFESMGLSNKQIHPVKADASAGLPFEERFFDAVVSLDSYNYFGRDPKYLGERLLPYVKDQGLLYLAFPGMKKDCHHDLPACLLKSWNEEQLDYMHDMDWWKSIILQTSGVSILDMWEMECTEESWADWLECDNEYAQGDRASVEAGALDYLNTIALVLQKN